MQEATERLGIAPQFHTLLLEGEFAGSWTMSVFLGVIGMPRTDTIARALDEAQRIEAAGGSVLQVGDRQQARKSGLYPVSKRIVDAAPDLFESLEAHEPGEVVGVDELWLTLRTARKMVGEKLSVEPLGDGRWIVACEWVYESGGPATTWHVAGNEAEVVIAAAAFLADWRWRHRKPAAQEPRRAGAA